MTRIRIVSAAVALACMGTAQVACATDVFRLEGFGAVSRAMGGVATAIDTGAAGMMTNPATLSLMNESDEFILALIARQFILAAGLAMAIASVWGFGESYAGAFHLPAWLIYPLFWACFGVVAPFVRSSR